MGYGAEPTASLPRGDEPDHLRPRRIPRFSGPTRPNAGRDAGDACTTREHWPGPYQGSERSRFKELINRAIRKLQRLNAKPNTVLAHARLSSSARPYETLRRIGMMVNMGHSGGSGNSVFEFVDMAAKENRRALCESVTVHGDVQLRNILVRDGREPHFIDYANCGRAIPCYDLVRLESAVLFYCFRMNSDEGDLSSIVYGHPEGSRRGGNHRRPSQYFALPERTG